MRPTVASIDTYHSSVTGNNAYLATYLAALTVPELSPTLSNALLRTKEGPLPLPIIGTGQVISFAALEQLVFEFEAVLKRFGITIKSGSQLERACLSVSEVLGRNKDPSISDPMEDIRPLFAEVLGIWTFLSKIVRLQGHASFSQFVPHLALLNKGTVVQNTRIPACNEATNKIFELLLGLVLLDVSNEVILDDPYISKGDNPDVLAKIDGQCWGFACKTIYGASGKTLYDNLKKGIEQIEAAPEAQIGIVVMNLRNFITHEQCWPLLNESDYRAGAKPIFSAYLQPEAFVRSRITEAVTQKCDQMISELGFSNVRGLFEGKKAVPALLAFGQTCTGRANGLVPIPVSMITLNLHSFDDLQAHQGVFEKINLVLHERV